LNDEPLLYRPKEACRTLGIGPTKLYELIGAGALDARKLGGRTAITGDSIRRYAQNLPKAAIGASQPEQHTPVNSLHHTN
jgi:excisionase family DNA binding protein